MTSKTYSIFVAKRTSW